MKKILIAAAFLACLAGNVMAEDQVTAKVSGTTLNIGLTNETSYCAFQMDITLPEGTTASAIEAVADRLSQDGSDTEIGGTKFIVASNVYDTENNILRVVAYNLNNDAITGTSGANILKITLDKTVADPTAITVSNITFVSKDDLAAANLPISTGKFLGDINKSQTVNSNDLAAMVDIIVYGSASASYSTYDIDAADLNGNGIVNANDLAVLIQLIINNN